MFSSFDLLIYFMQLPTLAAPLKIDFAPFQQWHIYIGLNHCHLLQHILPVLSQTPFPLSSCKIVAAPSSWVLNLIKFDGSRPSFCPKRTDTTDSRVFLWLPVSAAVSCLAHCLERRRDCWNRTACQRNQAPSEESPSVKISAFFGTSPFYRWNTLLYLKRSGSLTVKPVSRLWFFLWSAGISWYIIYICLWIYII